MLHRLVAIAAMTVVFGVSFAPISSFGSTSDDEAWKNAKRLFDRDIRSGAVAKRRAAVKHVVRAGHPDGIKAMRSVLLRTQKKIKKIDKKLDPLLDKRREIALKIDKRFAGQRRVSAGSVNALFKKQEEVTAKIKPLDDDMRLETATKNAILQGMGLLITSLEATERDEKIADILKLFKRVKPEDRLTYLEILAHIRAEQAVSSLVSIVLDDGNPNMRTAALDALGKLGDTRGGLAAVDALKDEYWQVRATAIATLEKVGHIDAVPLLIERLDQEEGRLKGDIITALTSMAGITYFDNAPLWKKWWENNEKPLRGILADLDSENPVQYASALEKMAEDGFLLGARKVLDKMGLSLSTVQQEEAVRLADPEDEAVVPGGGDAGGFKAEDQEHDDAVEAVGRCIATRKTKIRDRAFENLVLRPYRVSRDAAKKSKLLEVVSFVPTEQAAGLLKNIVAREPEEKASDEQKARLERQRLAAIRGLGRAATKDGIEAIAKLFSTPKVDKNLLLAAAKALGEAGTKDAVRHLVGALGDIESSTGRDDLEETRQSILASLQKLTRQEKLGDDFEDWIAWWRDNKKSFQTDRDREKEEVAKKNGNQDEKGGTTFYGIETWSKHIAYVLDVSGSMNEPAEYANGERRKIDVAKEELLKSLTSLPDDATFNIVFYSSDYRLWKKKMVIAKPKNKKAARAWVEKVTANGATNIYDPLAKAFEMAGRGTFDKGYEIELDTIFFLSDGQPNQGRIVAPADILREIEKINSLKKVEIHAIGVGKSHNRGFMERLAKMTGGTYIAR